MLKLEKIIFYFFIFCLPFQTRKIIYQWGANFNEWTSAYIYFTDILFIIICLFWFWRIRKQRFLREPLKLIDIKSSSFWLVVFLIFSLISLIYAEKIGLGFYSWFKLFEMIILFFYLKVNFRKLFSFKKLSYVFIISGLFQSFIAIGQYLQQKSLNLKVLAESPLSSEITGVAKIIVDNMKIIRSYGAFPHPNILAAFLLICIFFIFYLFLNKNKSFKKFSFLLISFFIIIFALFLTYSRLTIFIFLLSSIIYLFISFKNYKKQVFALFFILLISLSFISFFAWDEISSRFQVSSGEQSIGLRLFYNQTALFIISEYPLMGIGYGNFVWEISQMLDLLNSWIFQPVHNIYLLIASETGLIGLFFFLMFFYQLFREFKEKKENTNKYFLFLILSSLLFIGLSDHFLWTLQQGQLMFWIVLGLIASYSFKKKRPSQS